MSGPKESLDAIARLMDGVEWDADTLSEIAAELRRAGYVLREPGEDDAEAAERSERQAQLHCAVCGCDLHDGQCPEGHDQRVICDECGAAVPADVESAVSRFHAPSCSLAPEAVFDPTKGEGS